MTVIILLGLSALIAYVVADKKATQLERLNKEYRNTIKFLRSDLEVLQDELACAHQDLVEASNELGSYREEVSIHEYDPSLYVEDVDYTDPTTAEYWGQDETAEAIIESIDSTANFDSLKWTITTDGNSAAAYGDDYEDGIDDV